MSRITLIASCLVFLALAAGLGFYSGAAPERPVSYADRMGTRYFPAPPDIAERPRVTEIPFPLSPRLDAIWGSTGRDVAGHIWIGVSDNEDWPGSAHLFEYNPTTNALTDHGDVVSELKIAGLYRPGASQNKIHTKIIQAEDGYLYFASFDDVGEDPSKGIVSKWGGHLWRLRPGSTHWEHVHATPEALVAVAGNGRWIYALGYWGHILFQYETRKRTWREVKVGSVPGHVSRNFVVDARGHAYVPRAREWRPDEVKAHPGEAFAADLVEYDTDLRLVASSPLTHYTDASYDSHGLVGLAYPADGSIVVSTAVGYLYHIVPPANRDSEAAKVESLGAVSPMGASYPSSLFPIDDDRYLAGVTTSAGAAGIQWFVYDLRTKTSTLQKLPFDGQDLLLYGSSTRDDKGRFYVVGRQARDATGNKPIILRLELAS